MARPKKKVVDYFPHQCHHGKTMFILEQRYGNDGYAFWFKMLEMLGATEGHRIDCNQISTWEFLQAKARVTEEKCTEILQTLSLLDAIDKELWDVKIIWCQNFVDGIADAYTRRKVDLPTKQGGQQSMPTEADELYLLKMRCRSATNRAIKNGTLVKGPCAVCGATEVEAHHIDYTQPLNVIWFCSEHHKTHHNNLQIGINVDIYSLPKPSKGINEPRIPQSKVKESKVKETRKDIPLSSPPPAVPAKVKKIKTTLPDDFQISDRVRTWALKKGFDRLEEHLEGFKLRAQAKGYQYEDWDAAFMNAIREDWGKIRQQAGVSKVDAAQERRRASVRTFVERGERDGDG